MAVNYDDLWSGFWGDMQEFGPVHRHVTRMIVEAVRPLNVKSVLDVGCGTGTNLSAIKRVLGIDDLVGLDLSAEALQGARRMVNAQFITTDVVQAPPLSRCFDLVLSSQVIEHVPDDETFLARLFEMCGRYCFVGTMQGRMRASESLIGHLRNYTREGLVAKMAQAGFVIEQVIEWGFPFYSPLYRSAIELVGGNARQVSYSRTQRLVATTLYHLYRLNSSSHGDVIMVLARRPDA